MRNYKSSPELNTLSEKVRIVVEGARAKFKCSNLPAMTKPITANSKAPASVAPVSCAAALLALFALLFTLYTSPLHSQTIGQTTTRVTPSDTLITRQFPQTTDSQSDLLARIAYSLATLTQSGTGTTVSGTSLSFSGTSLPILNANVNRLDATLVNTGTSNIFIKRGAGAGANKFDYVLLSGTVANQPILGSTQTILRWTGTISAFVTGSAQLQVSELSK